MAASYGKVSDRTAREQKLLEHHQSRMVSLLHMVDQHAVFIYCVIFCLVLSARLCPCDVGRR